MISSFIITLRETLEAALIVGIILSFLIKTKQQKYNKIVYFGIIAGIIASILGAYIFNALAGGFEGKAEEIFEGITMLIGALLLTTMILWMMRQKHIAKEIEDKVAANISSAQKWGLFFLVFVSILREGIETVIFLGAANFVSGENNIWGAILGIVIAIILGYLIFVSSKKFNLKKFFSITSVVLILFAAGLVAHGIHELQEAGVVPIVNEHVFDINPELNSDGSYPLLHEKGHIGSIFAGLFGYNGNPSLIEIISYVVYILIAAFFWKRTNKKQATS